MSSEKPNSKAFDFSAAAAASTGGNQPMKADNNSPNTKIAASSNMGNKTLAERAVYGSQQRRKTGRRKHFIHGFRLLPSRLSKVSLADNSLGSD